MIRLPRVLARLLSCLLFLVMLAPGIAAAQQVARTALVIGNSSYSFAPLANPGNDANDIAKSLADAGFDVELLVNADRARMQEAVDKLSETLRSRGGVGLFFFAGHGLQVDGENYLIPIGDGLTGTDDLAAKAVSATALVNAMSKSGNALNIVILDACRDNPFTGKANGLTRIESSASLFVSYSTSPGAVALDGSGRNSPYTKHLTLALAQPDLNLEETFKRTLKGVYQETEGKQTPWLSSSFFGDFVFRGDKAAALAGSTESEASKGGQSDLRTTAPRQAINGIYRVAGTNPNGSRYIGMLTLSDEGNGADFTWWIGKDVFRGRGEPAGKMLVVDWNSTSPVVYSFAGQGSLDGEWADGSATEKLELIEAADPQVVPENGTYRVDGTNPDGSRYKGTLRIEGDGTRYDFSWKIGSSAYKGRGVLSNGIMVVNWGDTQPVIYAVRSDGSLSGLWSSGQASEVATPQ